MDAADVYLAKPTQDEIERHMRRRLKCTVGTLNPDGSIHLSFVIFLWESGKLYFETASMTKKARNVAANPTVSFAFESGDGFMAMAEGLGRVIGGDSAQEINARLRDKYMTDAGASSVGMAWAEFDDVAIEITPTRWRSRSSEALYAVGREASGDMPSSEWWRGED